MNVAQTGTRKSKEVLNPKVRLSETEAAAFNTLRERTFTHIDATHASLRDTRPTDDMRLLKGETKRILSEAFPNFEEHRQLVFEKFSTRFNKKRPDVLRLYGDEIYSYFDGIGEADRIVPGVGEFWWAQTSFITTMGEITVDLPDEFVHIFGHAHWEGDNLLTGSAGYIEDYVLSPNRFPSTSKTQFVINTNLRTRGILSGSTGFYHWLWAADDKWCKCTQVTRWTALLSNGEVLSNRVTTIPLIDLVNVTPVGQGHQDLFRGFFEFLTFDRDLAAVAPMSILVQVEMRYDIALEGNADIWFRNTGGTAQQSVPSMQNAVLCRSRPMILQTR
jgi:hypothetical protein